MARELLSTILLCLSVRPVTLAHNHITSMAHTSTNLHNVMCLSNTASQSRVCGTVHACTAARPKSCWAALAVQACDSHDHSPWHQSPQSPPASPIQKRTPTLHTKQLLGRADNLQDYVRRNCTSFFTEITLSSGGSARPTVVRRDVEKKDRGGHNEDSSRREGFESKWAINGG